MSNDSSNTVEAPVEPKTSGVIGTPVSPIQLKQPRAKLAEPVQDRRSTPWGPWSGVGLGLAAFLGSQLLAGFMIGLYLAMFGANEQQITDWFSAISGNFIFALVAEILAATLIVSLVRAYGGRAAHLGLTRLQWRYVWIALLGMAAYVGFFTVLSAVIGSFSSSVDFEQEQQLGFDDPQGIMELAMTAVSLVVLPPLVEELVFRGFIYGGLRRALPFFWAALITSLLFAAGHLELGMGTPILWIAGIDTFCLSLVMCFVREKTGSIWPTILMHFIKNGIAFMFLYLVK